MAAMDAAPVDGVVDTIVDALSAGEPEPRYVVGDDVAQLVELEDLPPAERDEALLSSLGLTRERFRAA
jgi:hypothetical protein